MVAGWKAIQRFLREDERRSVTVGLSAAIGLALLLTLIAVTTIRSQQRQARAAWQSEVETAGAVLAESVATLLSREDVDGVRRLLLRARQESGLARCRLLVGEGRILAAGEAAAVNTEALPESIEGLAPRGMVRRSDGEGVQHWSWPVMIPERGVAELRIEARPSIPVTSGATTALVLLSLSTAGLMGGLLLRVRRRLGALHMVRDALRAAAEGESDPSALRIDAQLGAEVAAWNALLAELGELRHRRTMEAALQSAGDRRSSPGRLNAACDAMSQGIILVDSERRVEYLNGAAATFLRIDRESAVGRPIDQCLEPAEIVEAVHALVEGRTRRRTVVEQPQGEDGGEGVLRFVVRPVRQADRAAAMVIVEDITQQRIAEQAQQAFVAQATHELRTPLTNIMLYVESAIEDGHQDTQALNNALNVINGEARRLNRIIADMLSVSEIEAGSHSLRNDDVRLEPLFENLKADYQAQADDKRIKLAFHLPSKLPVLHGDRDKLELTLHNLIGNALKYTPEGGEVRVDVRSEDGQLTVDVTDTGYGIAEADQARVFDKFYRAKDERISDITGSGLGLALAREVARMHGGDITLVSEYGKGSTFTLTMPIVEEVART